MAGCGDCNEKFSIQKGGYVPLSVKCNSKNKGCKAKAAEKPKKELTISLSNLSIEDFSPKNTEIGTFTTDKSEQGTFHLFSKYDLLNDNENFIIVNNKLKNKKPLIRLKDDSYKITVRYFGKEYEKIQDFEITVDPSPNTNLVEVGEQIEVLSSDESASLVFENVVTAGEVTLEKIDSEVDGFNFYNIYSDIESSGDTIITFNIPEIDPVKEPSIIQVVYDEETESLAYLNITTSFSSGEIVGTINSPIDGMITKIILILDGKPISLNEEDWELNEGESLITNLSCFLMSDCAGSGFNNGSQGFMAQVFGDGHGCEYVGGDTLIDTIGNGMDPCPGNQTRGNFAVTSSGIGLPRLLGGTCGCWQASFFSVDFIIGIITGIGAIKAGLCTLAGSIFNLKGIIKSLINQLFQIRIIIRNLRFSLIEAIEARDKLLDSIAYIKKFIASDLEKLKMILREMLEKNLELDEITDRLKIFPEDPGLIARKEGLIQEIKNLDQDAEILEGVIDTLEENLQMDELRLINKKEEIRNIEEELFTKQLDQTNLETNIEVKEKLLKESEESWATKLKEYAASMIALYAYLNEVSVQKECQEGETLNNLTCECCPPCPEGKVFPDPMNECNCVCAEGTVPCFNVLDDNCYEPCPGNQIRNQPDCGCGCIPPDELCGNNCYEPCPEDQSRNEPNCECECTFPTDELCNGVCYDPCPEGQTRNESTCECESGCTTVDADIICEIPGTCPDGWLYGGTAPGNCIYCCPPGTTSTGDSTGKCCVV